MQDEAHFGLALAVGVLALTFGLRVPPHVCVMGDVTMGGLVANTFILDKSVLDACVAAGKTLLVLPDHSREALRAALSQPDPFIYRESLRVCGEVGGCRMHAGWTTGLTVALVSTDVRAGCWGPHHGPSGGGCVRRAATSPDSTVKGCRQRTRGSALPPQYLEQGHALQRKGRRNTFAVHVRPAEGRRADERDLPRYKSTKLHRRVNAAVPSSRLVMDGYIHGAQSSSIQVTVRGRLSWGVRGRGRPDENKRDSMLYPFESLAAPLPPSNHSGREGLGFGPHVVG